MITGYANQALEPIVPIAVLDRNRHLWRLEVVVDTGFNGDLTLSLARINELRTPGAVQRKWFKRTGRLLCAIVTNLR